MSMQSSQPVAILGGGPVGLALSLLLAKRGVSSIVFDARTVERARADQRLLALSLGSLQTLRSVSPLSEDSLAPILRVIVSSVGQFGRAVIDERDMSSELLGATIRYGDLIDTLARRVDSTESIQVLRPVKVASVQQSPTSVELQTERGERYHASLALSAEGLVGPAKSASHSALVADLEVGGIERGTAFERFTREGPLALLPLPARLGKQKVALVWCMSNTEADRRSALGDSQFVEELRSELRDRKIVMHAIESRGRHPLHERAREQLVEHRTAYLGNAAQTLHPVAGQGLNLGLRDSVILADLIARAHTANADLTEALQAYARARGADRAAIVALTRSAPAFFSTRFVPIALARSIGLTALAVVPNLRREFARLLMFGVRF